MQHYHSFRIRPLRARDLQSCLELWRGTPGIGISHGDDLRSLRRFLRKNKGLCFLAVVGPTPVGTVLCGSDGRRGYIYHLAVEEQSRRTGLGRKLVEVVLSRLRGRGIGRCHAMMFADNALAHGFWGGTGWRHREDIGLYSFDLEEQT